MPDLFFLYISITLTRLVTNKVGSGNLNNDILILFFSNCFHHTRGEIMLSKNISLIVSTFLFLTPILQISYTQIAGPNIVPQLHGRQMSFYIDHDPILITSNADFATQGWPGDGTWSKPYLIEGLQITTDDCGIEIMDTTVYFEIKDCLITSDSISNYDGIILTNVVDGRVRDSIVEFHRLGIKLIDSQYCVLDSNTARSNMYCGFSISESSDCTLTNNNAIDNPHYGISLHLTDNCILINNSITNNLRAGISLSISDSSTCTNNELVGNGIIIGSTSISSWMHVIANNTVNGKPLCYLKNINDTVLDGTQYGQMILVNCSNVKIEGGVFPTNAGVQIGFSSNCMVVNTSSHGIALQNAQYCNITNNIVRDSEFFGIFLQDSMHCILMDNIVVNSEESGIYIGAGAFNSSLRNNVASDNWYNGFFIGGGSCVLENNSGNDNRLVGFYIDHDNNIVTNNSAARNSVGFEFRFANNCSLMNNIATANNLGLSFTHSVNCSIVDNVVFDNSNGIVLGSDTSGNVFYLNQIAYNGYSDSGARDDGIANRWDDGVDTGNYWTSYDGNGTFSVPGSAGSIDHFPLILKYVRIDKVLPIINNPSDIVYVEGDTGYAIVWTPVDDYPLHYSISRDENVVKAGDWTSSQEEITITADGLSAGAYMFKINVTDIGGNSAIDQVSVTVLQVANETTTATTSTTGIPQMPNIEQYLLSGALIFVAIFIFACFKQRKTWDSSK